MEGLQKKATNLESPLKLSPEPGQIVIIPGSVACYYAFTFAPTLQDEELDDDTRRHFAWAFGRYILPAIGNVQLSELTRTHGQDLIDDLRLVSPERPKPKLGPSSIHLVIRKLRQMINLAVEDGKITKSPLKKLRLPKLPPPRETPLTPAMVMVGINSLDRGMRSYCRLGLLGLNLQEVLGARLCDIKNGCLEVVHQREYDTLEDLKAEPRYRTIPIPAVLLAGVLEDAGEIFLAVKEDGRPLTRVDPWLLMQSHYPRPADWPQEEEWEVPETHDWRRFCNTILENELEAPKPVVEAIMGHGKKGSHSRYDRPKIPVLARWTNRLWDHVSTTITQNGALLLTETGTK